MAKNRLGREELERLNWMSQIKKELSFQLKAVEIYMELWKNEQLTAKGIDTQLPHEINLETGIIRAMEEPKENGKQKD